MAFRTYTTGWMMVSSAMLLAVTQSCAHTKSVAIEVVSAHSIPIPPEACGVRITLVLPEPPCRKLAPSREYSWSSTGESGRSITDEIWSSRQGDKTQVSIVLTKLPWPRGVAWGLPRSCGIPNFVVGPSTPGFVAKATFGQVEVLDPIDGNCEDRLRMRGQGEAH